MISLFRAFTILLPVAALVRTADAGMEVIAHRGAMRLAPENTLASQRLAYELGADYVEVDVRLTGDGVPINLHDHNVDRTTNGTGNAASMTYAQVRQLDAGSWFGPRFAGERIPSIAENLEVAKQYNRKVMFDIKGEYMYHELVEVIRQSGISLNQLAFLLYSDFESQTYGSRLPGVKILRTPMFPGVGTAVPAENITPAHLEEMRRQKVTTIILGAGYVSKYDLDRFHDAGFEVSALYFPYVSSFYYQDIGMDSYWTDYTDVTVGILTRTEQQWANWADMAGLAPDQRHTWMDPDGDTMSNLTEFALGSDPLTPGLPPQPAATSPGNIGWTMDLRENWSELLTATVQNSQIGPWYDLPPSALTFLSPTRLKFEKPITPGRQFFRMKFELIR